MTKRIIKRRRKKNKVRKIENSASNYTEPISCTLLRRSQYAGILPDYEPDLLKSGTYHGSIFHGIEGFGVDRWVVGAYIDVDFKSYIEQGLTIEDVLTGCIIHLNQPPTRKKYQRRQKNPLYGNLDPMAWRFGYKTIGNKEYIWVLLVTDKRKNRHFWGEGQKL